MNTFCNTERNDNIKQLIYEDYQWDIFLSNNYQFTVKHLDFLSTPKYSLKNAKEVISNLTYRKINDWDNKGLVSGFRKTKETGWRKFSIRDIVKLQIITDLRRLGLSTDKIKVIIDNLSLYGDNNKIFGKEDDDFYQLEYNIFACMFKQKILLVVDDVDQVYFLPENKSIQLHVLASAIPATPLIFLPFYSYIKILNKNLEFDERTTLDANWIFEKEQKIIKIIQDKKYEEIKIVKKDGSKYKVHAKTRKSGEMSEEDLLKLIEEKDYQNISIHRTNGKTIDVVQDITEIIE